MQIHSMPNTNQINKTFYAQIWFGVSSIALQIHLMGCYF